MEEIRITPRSEFLDTSIMDSGIRQDLDLIIVVIRKTDDSMLFNPKADTVLEVGDTMVVVGSARSIKQLERIA